MAKQDYYQMLGVSRGAGADEIKRAYRKLAMQFHPDRNPGDASAEHKFKEVNEAYDVLKDEQKRAAYDQFARSEEHTSELQSLMRLSYAVFCVKTKKIQTTKQAWSDRHARITQPTTT